MGKGCASTPDTTASISLALRVFKQVFSRYEQISQRAVNRRQRKVDRGIESRLQKRLAKPRNVCLSFQMDISRCETQRCLERRRYEALGAHIRIGLRRLYGTHSPYISAAEKDVKTHSGCSSASVLTTRVATKRRYSCADQQERSKRPGYGLYTSFASTRRKRAFSTLREFGYRQRRLSSDSLKSLSSSSPHAVCFI